MSIKCDHMKREMRFFFAGSEREREERESQSQKKKKDARDLLLFCLVSSQ